MTASRSFFFNSDSARFRLNSVANFKNHFNSRIGISNGKLKRLFDFFIPVSDQCDILQHIRRGAAIEMLAKFADHTFKIRIRIPQQFGLQEVTQPCEIRALRIGGALIQHVDKSEFFVRVSIEYE